MENKQFCLTIKGQKVSVSEEVYRAYIRPINARKRAELRNNKCQVKGERFGLVRCKEDCSKCPYFTEGNKRRGIVLSLDGLVEDGHEEAAHTDLESDLIEYEEINEKIAALHKAIGHLTEQQKLVIKELFFNGKTQQAVAEQFGISQQAVSNILNRALAALKKNLEKF